MYEALCESEKGSCFYLRCIYPQLHTNVDKEGNGSIPQTHTKLIY